ncbi:MAG: SDR family oxidoreductase [Planctomycetes bacterium]|nr:SDR family oxidoreductase [Planctomycetota bacterium]
MSLKKRLRIVITGATRGLGQALALGLSELGHEIYGCGSSEVNVEALQKKVPRCKFDVVDVTNEKSVAKWASIVLGHGLPDFLINNAAVINKPARLWEISEKEFGHLMDVNIKGIGNTIRCFVPSMVREKKGIIINLSSAWGRSVSGGFAPYCATKYAVEGLTKALALELPKGMAAIPLNPGIINTDMLQTAFGDGASGYHSASTWANSAVPFILGLTSANNGVSLTVP